MVVNQSFMAHKSEIKKWISTFLLKQLIKNYKKKIENAMIN